MTIETAPSTEALTDFETSSAGPFMHLMQGAADALRLALARLPERLPLFATALIGGGLVALFVPGRHVAVVALVVATTLMVVSALAYGVRTLRDDPTRSFLLGRPLHSAAIFWGEFLAATLTGALLGGLAVLPAALRAVGDPVQLEDLRLFWTLLAALPFAFLLTHTVLGLAEAKPQWWIASIVLASVTAISLGFVAGELASWTADRAAQILLVLVVGGIAIFAPLAAAHRRAARGRADRTACHRTFFRTFWPLVGLVVLAALGLLTAVETIEPGDLDPLVWQKSSDGRWIAMRAQVGDDARGLLANVRRGASAQLVIDTETDEWTRLQSAAGFLPFLVYMRNSHFSADGDTLVWESAGPEGTADELTLLDLETRAARQVQRPHDLPARWWVGPDEQLLIGWNVRFIEHETEDGTPKRWSLDWSFSAYDLGSAIPFVEWSFTSERDAGTGAYRGEWPRITASRGGTAIVVVEDQQHFARYVIDKNTRRLTEEFEVALAAPTDRDLPEARFARRLAGKQWEEAGGAFWVAHGNRLFRLDHAATSGALDPAAVVHEEPDDHWIWDVLVLPDRILLMTFTPVEAEDSATRTKSLVVLPKPDLADRRVVATGLESYPAFNMRIADDSLVVGRSNGEEQHVLVLGQGPGAETLMTVADWADSRGLPATARIRMPYFYTETSRARERPVAFTNQREQVFLPRGDSFLQLRPQMAKATTHRPLRQVQ